MILPKIRKRGARRRDRGQALVEFSLVLIPLMLIFMGILQFGMIFSAQIGLINSTREGARYGATLQTDGYGAAAAATTVYCYTVGYNATGTGNCAINTVTQTGTLGRSMAGFNINQLCRSTSNPTDASCGSDLSSVSYCYYPDPNGTTYSLRLNVRMVYRHPLVVPMIGAVVDGIDGHADNALRASTEEHFRVEGPSMSAGTASGGGLVPACTN